MEVDKEGNIYAVAYFIDSMEVGPIVLSPTAYPQVVIDGAAFIHLNNNGDIINATCFSSESVFGIAVTDLCVDLSGDVYMSGNYVDDLVLCDGDTILSPGSHLYIAHYDLPSGINQVKNSNYAFYPNPLSGIGKLQLKDQSINNGTLLVYDITGRQCQQSNGLSGNEFVIDVSAYPEGVYFLPITE
jgi:hypothetical protein